MLSTAPEKWKKETIKREPCGFSFTSKVVYKQNFQSSVIWFPKQYFLTVPAHLFFDHVTFTSWALMSKQSGVLRTELDSSNGDSDMDWQKKVLLIQKCCKIVKDAGYNQPGNKQKTLAKGKDKYKRTRKPKAPVIQPETIIFNPKTTWNKENTWQETARHEHEPSRKCERLGYRVMSKANFLTVVVSVASLFKGSR